MQVITAATRHTLAAQLGNLGLAPGAAVMIHVSLRALGPLVPGPAALIDAILDCIGPAGTLMAYVSWDCSPYEETLGHTEVPQAIRDRWPAFDPATASCYPGFGAINEFIRRHPDCQRSAHPDASMAAIGARAAWLVAPHRLDSAYGPGSPIERFLQLDGKVLSIGAGPDAVTVLHYAEALANIPGKRRIVYAMPLMRDGERVWETARDWDSNGILDAYTDEQQPDAVERIARDYLALGRHREGLVGRAVSRLIDANDIVKYGIAWLEARHGQAAQAPRYE